MQVQCSERKVSCHTSLLLFKYIKKERRKIRTGGDKKAPRAFELTSNSQVSRVFWVSTKISPFIVQRGKTTQLARCLEQRHFTFIYSVTGRVKDSPLCNNT